MPDFIHDQIDLKARPAEVYAYTEDPTTGQFIAPAKQVAEVVRGAGGRIESFRTKRGTLKYTLHAFPHFWQGEYHMKRYRTRYDVRFESIGEAATRVLIEINLQPQGLLAKLQGPIPRWRAKSQLNDWLEQAQKHFNGKK